jgi:release factor glutamine methyltransferase
MPATSEHKKIEPVWNIRNVLNWTTKRFKESGIETPLLDTQLLLSHALNLTKIQLYTDIEKPLTEVERAIFRELVKKRLSGEPVAYLLAEKYWHDLKLYVDKRVLIPRPETETLLDFVLQVYKHKQNTPKVIFDFCTGSGCLALALAKEFPTALVIGVDISQDALSVAKINAERNDVKNVEWINADVLCEELFFDLKTKFGAADIVVANPPYVTESEWQSLDLSVKNYEPKIALVSENEGIKFGECIFNSILKYELLSKDSVFAMELAEKQPHIVTKQKLQIININHPLWQLTKNEWFALCDYENKDRFLIKLQNLLKDS